jgi:hypothetical protein
MSLNTQKDLGEEVKVKVADMAPARRSDERARCVSPRLTPKFVDHEELRGPAAYRRFFESAGRESTAERSIEEKDLRRFKRMHFCALRMEALARRYGPAAIRRPDYRQFSELHRKLQDEIAYHTWGSFMTCINGAGSPTLTATI